MCRFGELSEGKRFEYEGNLFEKTRSEEDTNAINLYTNKRAGFIPNAYVYAVVE